MAKNIIDPTNNIKYEQLEDYQKIYFDYIIEHRENNLKVWNELKKTNKKLLNKYPDIIAKVDKIIDEHDLSKFSDEEFYPYAEKFQGNNKDSKEVLNNFQTAWLHHIHNNPHHWNYHIIVSDESPSESKDKTGLEPLPMPIFDVLAMLIDWESMSIKFNNSTNDFYNTKIDKSFLHPETIKLIEELLPSFS